MDQNTVKDYVREHYGSIAEKSDETSGGCCGSGCCSTSSERTPEELSGALGYSKEEMQAVPDGSNLGLGCGNPLAGHSIREGETVLDLGSGAGFDSFLAARKVGPTGRVIGVDMTPQMISRARANATKVGADNVEFRLGEVEHLPVADSSVDLLISNCVINLVPDKAAVFKEAFRALKPEGRLIISDIVLRERLPEKVEQFLPAIGACIGGASLLGDYVSVIRDAGFGTVEIQNESELSESWVDDPQLTGLIQVSGYSNEEIRGMAHNVVSVTVMATKA